MPDTRSRRLARRAEAVRVSFQAKRTTASDEKQRSGLARMPHGLADPQLGLGEKRIGCATARSTALVPDAPSYLSRSSTALDT